MAYMNLWFGVSLHGMDEIVWIALASTCVVALCHRFRLPSLLGFLVVGVLLGPAGMGLVKDSQSIEFAAEMGVVFLLFTIGLEISLEDLLRMWKQVLGGGLLQMVLTTSGVMLLLWWGLGQTRIAFVIGLIVATSSTALVLRLLGESGELGTASGRLTLAILLMQDFAVVGFMLLLPMLGQSDTSLLQFGWSFLKAGLVTGGIFFLARFCYPWILRKLVQLRSREVFLLFTLSVVFGTAFVAGSLGLSLALGAFVAGLVVSESEFSHQMFAEILPFRDVLNGVFFVSVGLLLQPEILWSRPWWILSGVAFILLWKCLVVVGVAKFFRLSWYAAIFAGVALSQVGEFGLVLAKEATKLQLITSHQQGLIVASVLLTMLVTPFALLFLRRFEPKTVVQEFEQEEGFAEQLDEHVILVGYGLNGRNVARALLQLGVRFVVVEMNHQTVRREKANGVPIVYGDATNHVLLEHLHVERARVFVSAIADATATRDIVAHAHKANPQMFIIARTRYVAEIQPLQELGATRVIPEEFETSIELFGRILQAYGVPNLQIEQEKNRLRHEQYAQLLQEDGQGVQSWLDLFSGLQIERIMLQKDSDVSGRSLRDLNLRVRTGATVLAILRGNEIHSAPDGAFRLEPYDTLLVVGSREAILAAKAALLAYEP